MASGENFCLRLNEFESNVKTYWKQLQVEKDFCDVTLACDDRHIKTHKVLISSFSPVLKSILKQNPNSHPLIYLRRVKYGDLQNLVNFMYQGEVDVAEEDLPTFLEVAEDLQIRGLSERNQVEDHSKSEELTQNYPSMISPSIERKETVNDKRKRNSFEPTHLNDHFIEPEHAMNKSSSLAATKSNIIARTKINESSQSLVVAGDKPFSCEKCDKYFSGKSGLYMHNASVHEGVRYPCQQCDYKAKEKHTLKIHVASIHDGVRYPCQQCDYKATEKPKLKRHVESIHDGVRYPCEFCDYKATQRGHLLGHKLTHKKK